MLNKYLANEWTGLGGRLEGELEPDTEVSFLFSAFENSLAENPSHLPQPKNQACNSNKNSSFF